jgi:hypothetical protein
MEALASYSRNNCAITVHIKEKFVFCFRRLLLLASVLASIASPLSVQAQEHIQPDISLSSNGVGIGAGASLRSGDEIHIEGSLATLKYNGNGTYLVTGANGANPVTLDLSLSEQVRPGAVALTYDHYLKKQKPLYVSAGIVANLLSIDAQTQTTQSNLVFAGQTYSAAELGTIGIHAHWRVLNPYLGVGWNHKDENGHSRGARVDIGAYTIGKPSVGFTTDQFIAINPQIFGPYIESLRQKLVSDLGGLTIYPILRISVPVGGRR